MVLLEIQQQVVLLVLVVQLVHQVVLVKVMIAQPQVLVVLQDQQVQ